MINAPADGDPDRAIRRRVLYSGQVQGVGFRFTACQVAAGFDVTGAVRNLRDSSRRVEVVAEGRPSELDAFLGELARRMKSYVSGAEVEESPATGEFAQFEVRY